MTEKRPERLPYKLRCGDCEWLRSIHPKRKVTCVEAFGVGPRHRACVEMEPALRPKRYRKDPEVQKYLESSEAQLLEIPVLLEDAQSLLEDGVFAARQRDGTWRFDTEKVLRRGGTTDRLVPLYERVQRLRERALILRGSALEMKQRADTFWERASSYLLRTYRELRVLKPEGVRTAIFCEILSEIDTYQSQAGITIDVCDSVIRNAHAAHEALMEIQASTRQPYSLPTTPKSSRNREAGSRPIKRGTSRGKRR